MTALEFVAKQAAAGGLGAADPVQASERSSGQRSPLAPRLFGPPRRLVAVIGDVRLLCESLAYVLGAAGIPAVVIDMDDPSHLAVRPDTVILAVRCETDLDAALEFVDRSCPGRRPVLLALSGVPGEHGHRPSSIGRLEIGAPVESLVHTVTCALQGGPAHNTPAPARRDVGEQKQLGFLTPRERQVLELLAVGNSVTHIATRLEIAGNTVRTHLANIRSKLGVRTRLEAVLLLRHDTQPAARPWAR